MNKYYGVYRGKVLVNDDSGDQDFPYTGRIKVDIPQIYGSEVAEESIPWASPCTSLAGPPLGDEDTDEQDKITFGTVLIPPVGSTVWVMFEAGDPQIPVYIGGWFPLYSKSNRRIPQEAIRADNTNISGGSDMAQYPEIMLVKSPYRKDMYVRFNGSHSMEARCGDDTIIMVAPTEEGGDDGEVYVASKQSNITIQVADAFRTDMDEDKGKITLLGNNVTIRAKKKLEIICGETESNEDGSISVVTEGDITIQGTKNMTIGCYKQGKLQAGDKNAGAWRCSAKSTSGFESH